MKLFRNAFLFALCLTLFAACSARTPSAKTAQRVTKSYFQRYGKKFKDTPFAKGNIDHISINGIEEVSYKNVYVDADVALKSAGSARTLLRMENHFPGGWRVLSWEVLNAR